MRAPSGRQPRRRENYPLDEVAVVSDERAAELVALMTR